MNSSPRGGAKVRLLAVHTTEGILKAPDLKAFFDRTDATGSCHASADASGALHGPDHGFVPYDRAAWTIRNGNPITDNIELCGFAKWTRADWMARPKLLDACAMWLADRARARGIPLVKLSPADVKAGKSGVIGHVDWTQGMNDGTHWDPGPDFPWDVVLGKADWLLHPTAPAAPNPAPKPAPKEAVRMRSVQLTADHPVAVLTVDPVGKSLVMPAGSRAWVQWQAFYPGDDKAVADVDWLVLTVVGGGNTPVAPFKLPHRGSGSVELPAGCNAVEVRVNGIPAGGVVGLHIDGTGHA